MLLFVQVETQIFKNWGEILAFSAAVLTLIGLILAPIEFYRFTLKFLREKAKPRDEQQITKEQKSFFMDYKFRKEALLYPIFFFTRRYLMILVITLLPVQKVF